MNLEGVEKVFGGGRKVILGGVESEFGGGRFQKFSARFARPRSTPPKINPVSGPGLDPRVCHAVQLDEGVSSSIVW